MVKIKTIKRTAALFLLAASVSCSAAQAGVTRVNPDALDPSTLTGKDWMALSRLERGVFVFSAIEAFKKCRVPLNESPALYTAWMDAELAGDGAIHDLKAKYILTAMILIREPHCRPAIEKLKI